VNEATAEYLPVPGVRLGSVGAGIKYSDRDDMVVVELAEGSRCAAVFTRNAFRAQTERFPRASFAPCNIAGTGVSFNPRHSRAGAINHVLGDKANDLARSLPLWWSHLGR